MTRRLTAIRSFAITALALCPLVGCAVGQPRGNGKVHHIQEPVTKGWYYLYLPEDYLKTERNGLTRKQWPLVVTFHGMKPFDTASSQIREWQQEADRYGFVVVAPQCLSPYLLDEFPLRHVHPRVKSDEALTVGMLDDVARRVDIDPSHVLSTSWSSGGYLAHYMANRHSERFSCVAPRQSNFASAVLDAKQVPKYRDMKIGIFYTENDFAICRRESQEAARWYSQHGFDVTFAVFKDLGHERRPSVAAEFFAQTCGATAKTPPAELARMQVKNVPLPALAATTAQTLASSQIPPLRSEQPKKVNSVGPLVSANKKSRQKPAAVSAGDVVASTSGKRPTPTPPRQVSKPPSKADSSALRIRVSSTIGIAPLLVSFSAIVPNDMRRGSFFLWTVDGEPISNAMNGQKYLAAPGKHSLEVLMTTSDGKELQSTKIVTVLERISHAGANSRL